jgi:DNA polymerase (family 10)
MTERTSNAEAARAFRLLADLLEIGGESAYRVGAYRRAAEGLERLSEPLEVVRRRGGLQEIPGIGPSIARKIGELLDTGTIQRLEEVGREVPPGVAGLLTVPDVGPKRARLLWEEAGIDGLDALRAALEAGRVDELLGPSEARRINQGLGTLREGEENRLPLGVARRMALDLIDWLREAVPSMSQIEAAGSIRRFRETVGDLDIVAASEEPREVVETFAALDEVLRVELKGPNRCRVILGNGFPADLWVLPERYWASLFFHVTGDKYHDIRLRDMAISRGGRLNEYGYTEGDMLTTFATEGEIYEFFGMQYVPAPMRSDSGEIELALRGELPRVLGLDDLKGDLHAHSNWSDGTASVREMALAAKERGHEYLAITDHSHGLGVANGLDAERLRAQGQEIDRVNAELTPFRVLRGVELEVRADGSLDLPDRVLGELDLVVASVHTGLRQDRERLTTRALSAMRHPLVDVLAHPTGRILGGRSGGDFDMDALYAEAAKTGTVLEIDGDPSRMDLRDAHARAAIAAGCTLSVDSDAHSVRGLGNLLYGVGVAQRAWVLPERVLNTLPLDGLLAQLEEARRRKGPG